MWRTKEPVKKCGGARGAAPRAIGPLVGRVGRVPREAEVHVHPRHVLHASLCAVCRGCDSERG